MSRVSLIACVLVLYQSELSCPCFLGMVRVSTAFPNFGGDALYTIVECVSVFVQNRLRALHVSAVRKGEMGILHNQMSMAHVPLSIVSNAFVVPQLYMAHTVAML